MWNAYSLKCILLGQYPFNHHHKKIRSILIVPESFPLILFQSIPMPHRKPLFFFFFFFLIFYLLLFWLLWVFFAAHGFSSSCSAGASYCGGFSFCKAQTVGLRPLVVAAHGVTSCGSQALELWLSSCGEPMSPSLAVEFLTTLPPGMSGTTVLSFIMVN